MNDTFEYQCTRCGKPTPRKELTIKRAVFMTPGEGAKTLRSRVTDHLCPRCVASDQDWQRPANQKVEYHPKSIDEAVGILPDAQKAVV